MPRKEINTFIGLALKNAPDWDGRRGRRIRDPASSGSVAVGNDVGDEIVISGIIQQSVNLLNPSP